MQGNETMTPANGDNVMSITATVVQKLYVKLVKLYVILYHKFQDLILVLSNSLHFAIYSV